jgi:hypothetical protein
MENSPGAPLNYRVHHGEDRGDRYEPPPSNTLHVDDTTAVRDGYNGSVVPVVTAAMHEQGHMLGREGISTLQGIPAGAHENMEEKRVIEGVEARDMTLRHHPQRHSHYGSVINVHELDSLKPSMEILENGKYKNVEAPYKISGTFGESKDNWTTINVAADGKTPAHEIKVRTPELALAMGGDTSHAQPVIDDAHKHGETFKLELTAGGRMVYENPTQESRLHTHPEAGVQYPDAMPAVREPAPARASAGVQL